jgi:transcriptional regulator with XRE-family HTH domain
MRGAFQENDSIHLGNNVKRIREIIGMKQFALAEACGWSQQQMSKLENSDLIDDGTLDIIASNLGVNIEFVKSFREDKAIYNIQNNNVFRENSSTQHFKPILNNSPVDQIVNLLEKFIEEDRKKTNQIEFLTNSVMDLAQEIKRMKDGK